MTEESLMRRVDEIMHALGLSSRTVKDYTASPTAQGASA